MVKFQTLAATLAMPIATLAHPGENVEAIKREMALRNEQHAYASRALAECHNSASSLARRERAMARRTAKAVELREKRGLSSSML